MSQDIYCVEWNGAMQGMTASMLRVLTFAEQNPGWHWIEPRDRVAVERLERRKLVEVDKKMKGGAHYSLAFVSAPRLSI